MPIDDFHQLGEQEEWIRFDWASYILDGAHFPRAAMTIPFIDANTREPLQLQFDTGAPHNRLYDQALQKYATARALPQPQRGKDRKTLEMEFEGNFPRTQVSLESMENFGANDTPEDRPLVGTMGLEFLGDIGFAIDYPRQRLYLLSATTLDRLEERHAAHFHPFLTSYGKLEDKIVFPFSIGNREDHAIFDTGSSMFELSLPRQGWEALTHASFEQADKTLHVPSWGETLKIYGKQVQLPVQIAGETLPLSEIYSSSSPEIARLTILGNQLFFDRVLIVDRRKKLFSLF